MSATEALLNDKINTAKNACIERRKKSNFFSEVFKPRKSFESQCMEEARGQYKSELDALYTKAAQDDAALDSALDRELSSGNNKNLALLVIAIMLVIIVLVIRS